SAGTTRESSPRPCGGEVTSPCANADMVNREITRKATRANRALVAAARPDRVDFMRTSRRLRLDDAFTRPERNACDSERLAACGRQTLQHASCSFLSRTSRAQLSGFGALVNRSGAAEARARGPRGGR